MQEMKHLLQERPRYLYYGILGAYILSLLTILTFRLTAGSGVVQVETNQVGQYVALGQNRLTVSDLIYNPEAGIVEVDVYVEKNRTQIDPLPTLDFAALAFRDTDHYLPQEVLQVKENYYALFFHVPEDFQALSLTIREKGQAGGTSTVTTRVRYLEDDFQVDPSFQITEDPRHYEGKMIGFEIQETENLITKNRERTAELEEEITRYEEKIQANEQEKRYLLLEEQAELENQNVKLASEIGKMEQEGEDLVKQNRQLEEKISLANQKKEDLQNQAEER